MSCVRLICSLIRYYYLQLQNLEQKGVCDQMAESTGQDPEKLELRMSMGFSGKRSCKICVQIA